jgi:adenosylhomocysteine nucleosidase
VGIVAALTAEARTLGPAQPAPASGGLSVNTLADGNLLIISGMGPDAAAQAARALVAAGAGALLSFGLAGALDPGLEAGAVLLPAAVIDGTGTAHATCVAWRARLAARGCAQAGAQGRIVDGALLSLATPLTTLFGKSQARARTGAVAVDMESFAIAQIALELGVQFAVARVVLDTAADGLPDAVLQATGARGEVNYPRLIAALIRRPPEVLALLRLARRYRVALRSLRALAGAGLGLP